MTEDAPLPEGARSAPPPLYDALLAAAGEVRLPVGEGSYGTVMLVDAMPRLVPQGSLGPEAAIVQAARVSYGAGTTSVSSDEVLMRYLLRMNHMTPFEMVVLKFRVHAPLFTARQWMRHRSGAFNEESARYSVVGADCYVPLPEEVCAQSTTNRQGSGAPLAAEAAAAFVDSVRAANAAVAATYHAALGADVARELARIVQPEGRYTTFYWTVNLRNLFGFLELRTDAHAQSNIRAYADAIRGILEHYCPAACRAFADYRLNAVSLTVPELALLRSELRGGDGAAGAAPPAMTSREKSEWAAKRARLHN